MMLGSWAGVLAFPIRPSLSARRRADVRYGPYYLTALVHCWAGETWWPPSPARHEQRVATCKEHFGERLPVEVPTHLTGALEFHKGRSSPSPSASTSGAGGKAARFQSPAPTAPSRSRSQLLSAGRSAFPGSAHEWKRWPIRTATRTTCAASAWPIWLTPCARDVRTAAACELAYHVLNVMHAFEESSITGEHLDIASTCPQPAPLPLGLLHGTLDRSNLCFSTGLTGYTILLLSILSILFNDFT